MGDAEGPPVQVRLYMGGNSGTSLNFAFGRSSVLLAHSPAHALLRPLLTVDCPSAGPHCLALLRWVLPLGTHLTQVLLFLALYLKVARLFCCSAFCSVALGTTTLTPALCPVTTHCTTALYLNAPLAFRSGH